MIFLLKRYSLLFLLLLLSSCSEEETPAGSISFKFTHRIDGEDITFNELRYVNAAGNHYEVKEIQWFISEITLIGQHDQEIILDQNEFSHYIDTNLPATLEWFGLARIATGQYKAIRFTFGLKGDKNIPGQFTDMPESNMVWPYHIGGDHGGYHYMKLNGFWMDLQDNRTPFNLHMGVGQLYNNEGEITQYVQNWFEVTIPVAFSIHNNHSGLFEITMNVESWFDIPHLYDHNVYGGMIMTNQEAMNKVKENGRDVFFVREISE